MKTINSVCRAVGYPAVVIVLLLMILTVVDVFLRYTFSSPIKGAAELTEMMMVWMLLTVAWCALTGRHVSIDLIMSRFRSRVQAVVGSITLLISLGVYGIMAWRSFIEAQYAWSHNVRSVMLRLPEYISLAFFGLSFAVLCIAIVALLVQRTAEVIKR